MRRVLQNREEKMEEQHNATQSEKFLILISEFLLLDLLLHRVQRVHREVQKVQNI